MQAYRVIGKPHRRVTLVAQTAIASDGTRIEIKQNGPLVTYGVGDVIEDIRLDELEAFPDRFVAATSAEVDTWHERQSHLPMVMRAPGLSAEQALEHADLTRQIADLQAKQSELLVSANTPVPTELPMEEDGPTQATARSQRGVPRAEAPGHDHGRLGTGTEARNPQPPTGPVVPPVEKK